MPARRLALLPLIAVVASFVSTSSLVALEPQDKTDTPPNFVLVMADDQGWGDVGFRNPALQTPVLDELAATGLHFTRFYAAAPVCSPTRASVLTGRHPNRFGCFSWGHRLRPNEITVAEALRDAGYTTGHFGKWHLGSVAASADTSPGASGFDEWISSPNFYDNNPLMSHRGHIVEMRGESSLVTADAAIAWLRQIAPNKRPFLAVVWFGSPHDPHRAAERYRAMYSNGGHSKQKQNFFGEMTAMDEAVGRIRATLRELKIADDTVVWYTSDNGALPVGSAGGLSGRKGTLREGGLRVPTMIEWPAVVKTARVIDAPCGTVDIYPTLLELAGLEVPRQPRLDGISLQRVIRGASPNMNRAMGFWTYPAKGQVTYSRRILEALREQNDETNSTAARKTTSLATETEIRMREFVGHAAWLRGRFKLHRRTRKNGPPVYRLFDLARDAKEQHDIAPTDVARVEMMKKELAAWQRSVMSSHARQELD